MSPKRDKFATRWPLQVSIVVVGDSDGGLETQRQNDSGLASARGWQRDKKSDFAHFKEFGGRWAGPARVARPPDLPSSEENVFGASHRRLTRTKRRLPSSSSPGWARVDSDGERIGNVGKGIEFETRGGRLG